MEKNNTTPILVLGLVALILGGMIYLVNQNPPEIEPPVWTILNPPSDVTCMVEQDGVLWVGGKAGVVSIDIETKEVEDIPCSERMTYTRHMLLDGDTLWIGHDRGLTRYTADGCRTLTEQEGMVDDRVNYLLKTNDTLWAGTWHGAYYLRDSEWNRITVNDGLLDNYVNTMIEDSYGGIWFGSYTAPNGGISIYMDGEWQYFSTDNGLVHNNIVQFFEDTDGSIWVSTGLMDVGAAIKFTYNGEAWEIAEVLDDSDGLPLGKIRSVYRDPDGYLWIGSENNGLSVETDEGFKILTTEDGLSHDEVKVYFVASDGGLWLGTRNGITVLSKDDLVDIRGS